MTRKRLGEVSKDMQRIRKEDLAGRLERAIHCDVGMQGLNTLIHGWLNYRKYGQKYREAIRHREWLYITEVMDLSEYAGYDLSKMEF